MAWPGGFGTCWWAAIAFCGAATACSYENDDYEDPQVSTEPLHLIASTPGAGQTQVPRATQLELVFDEPLAAETVSLLSVRLFSGLIETRGSLTVDLLQHTIHFVPVDPLLPDLRYQVYINKEIQGLSGRKLTESLRFDFRTGSQMEAPPPSSPTPQPDPEHVQGIWSSRCVSGCHEPPRPRARLDLSTSAEALRSLSGVPSTQWEMLRVTPREHARSYLMRKVLGQGGHVGFAMPPAGPYLGPNDLRAIADWIDGGAQP